jgi:PDZ domain-containing protein
VTEQLQPEQLQPVESSPPGSHRPRHVRVLALVIVLLLVAGAWIAIDRGAAGYYAFSPGSAPRITPSAQCREAGSGGNLQLPNGVPCARLGVPVRLNHGIDGTLYMVDVLVGPATPIQYLFSKVGLLRTFFDGTQLVPKDLVLGTTPPEQLACQDSQQMDDATSTASVVALRNLGYQVVENDLGAQLYQVAPGSPAAKAGLECNDLVTKVNSTPIHTADELTAAIHAAKPGQDVHITVQRPAQSGKPKTLTVTAHLTGTPAEGGQPARPTQAFLGVVAMTHTTFTFPFRVTIDVGNIGGPSAGLALTLGLLDVLSDGNLTGGHRVAATGTINFDDSVGDVGGVAQKAVAVRRAGAQVFFVPPQELAAAKSEAGSMQVHAVSTLQQALGYLKAMGGHVPVPATGREASR